MRLSKSVLLISVIALTIGLFVVINRTDEASSVAPERTVESLSDEPSSADSLITQTN